MQNGSAATSSFSVLSSAVPDDYGNLFISDYLNCIIRKVDAAGNVTTYAGGNFQGRRTDGPAAEANFYLPTDVVTVGQNVFVCDWDNWSIRKITPDGYVSTIAGGSVGYSDGPGLDALFRGPIGITADASGNLFVCDEGNHVIRKIAIDGVVTTLAGSGSPGYKDDIGRLAQFQHPYGITIDAAGNLYVTDRFNHRVRKITQAGVVSTIAGNGVRASVDGKATEASFNMPWGITIDPSGNLYTCSYDDNLIRKITPDGNVTTFAGSAAAGNQDGLGPAATFTGCQMLSSDKNGNIYVANSLSNQVRKIVTSGYAIDKTLPAGLIFDTATGIISGTPTAISVPADYTITAYNGTGRSNAIINIGVSEAPVISFEAIQPVTICTTDFSPAATSNAGKLSYASSNTAVATIVDDKVHITGPGNTIITASSGGISAHESLTVAAPIAPTAFISSYTGACEGMPVIFTVTVNNGGVHPFYQWKVDGLEAGTNSPYLSYVVTPANVITCTVTYNEDCGAVAKTPGLSGVKSEPETTPSVTIHSSATGPVCSGENLTFTASPVAGGIQPSYQWMVNSNVSGTNSPQFSSNVIADGDEIRCTMIVNGGVCTTSNTAVSNTIKAKVNLPALTTPSVTVDVSGNGGYFGDNISFTASAAPAGKAQIYHWSVNGKNVTANGSVFSSHNLKNLDVVVCTVSFDDVCNPLVTSDPVTITLLPPLILSIPNTFTPNGDGINDFWDIPSLDGYPDCIVNIYNRYGTRVFRSTGYHKPWDGTVNGSLSPAGTYYYTIKLKDKSTPLSGWISILK